MRWGELDQRMGLKNWPREYHDHALYIIIYGPLRLDDGYSNVIWLVAHDACCVSSPGNFFSLANRRR